MLNSNYPAFPAELTGSWVCPGLCNTSWQLPFLCLKWICSPTGWPLELDDFFLRHHNLLSLLNCWCKLGAAWPHFNTGDEAWWCRLHQKEAATEDDWIITAWEHTGATVKYSEDKTSCLFVFLKLQQNWYFPLYFKISCQKKETKILG